MTKVTNKQIAAVFRHARSLLWSGYGNSLNTHPYICHAISDQRTYRATGCDWRARDAAIKVIRKRLGSSYSAEAWLVKRGIIAGSQRKMQAWRRQWITQLINEFENK